MLLTNSNKSIWYEIYHVKVLQMLTPLITFIFQTFLPEDNDLPSGLILYIYLRLIINGRQMYVDLASEEYDRVCIFNWIWSTKLLKKVVKHLVKIKGTYSAVKWSTLTWCGLMSSDHIKPHGERNGSYLNPLVHPSTDNCCKFYDIRVVHNNLEMSF